MHIATLEHAVPKQLCMREYVRINNNTYHVQIVIAHAHRNGTRWYCCRAITTDGLEEVRNRP